MFIKTDNSGLKRLKVEFIIQRISFLFYFVLLNVIMLRRKHLETENLLHLHKPNECMCR